MTKCFIFDFDGVIADTEKRKFHDLKKILGSYGYALNKLYFDKMVGKKTLFFLSSIYPELSKETLKEICSKRRKMQNSDISSYNPISGIKELLGFLKKKGYIIALTTGSEKNFVKKILKHNLIDSYFDLIISGESFKSSKPNPECYTLTLNKLGLSPSEAIIVEDSAAGIEAGKKSGCKVFAVMTYLNKRRLSKADKVFKSHKQVLSYLKSTIK